MEDPTNSLEGLNAHYCWRFLCPTPACGDPQGTCDDSGGDAETDEMQELSAAGGDVAFHLCARDPRDQWGSC